MSEILEDKSMPVLDRPYQAADVRVEPTDRRVRAVLGGETVVDTRRALILFEKQHLPVYYLPIEDVREELLERSDRRTTCPRKGEATWYTVRAGERVAQDAVWRYEQPIESCPDISRYAAFYWDRVDAWFEEDDQVYVHPRDPYHRVDVLHSSRHVQVVVGGEVVGESRRPRLLFETGLPTRHYLPKLDVRLELMTPSPTTTRCPYKGEARYWSIDAGGVHHDDIAWSYPAPIPECSKIEDLVCFFDEHVDAVIVDGVTQPRPRTPWSRR